MERIEMTPKELETARRKYDLFGRNETFTEIEKFSREKSNGDYVIVGGRLVPMERYGETITEGDEELDIMNDFQSEKRWRKMLNESN